MTKRAPSFPYLTDEYEPTNTDLWEKVKEVARGDTRSLTVGSRTITKPDKFVWPSPPASAWAVKQYNGFGGSWRKTAVFDILKAGGIVTARTGDEQARMRRLSERGLAQKIGESGGAELWERVDQDPEQRVLSRWKQALLSLDAKELHKAINKAVSRTRDYSARVKSFKTKKGRNGQWSAEAFVDYKYPSSKLQARPGKTPLIAPLRLLFEFDPTTALSLRAEVHSPVLNTTKKIYENHRITGDYERTVRSVLLSYQPEVVWK